MSKELIVEKTECRKAFESFASLLGFDIAWGDNVYADEQTHLVWIGFRQAWNRKDVL